MLMRQRTYTVSALLALHQFTYVLTLSEGQMLECFNSQQLIFIISTLKNLINPSRSSPISHRPSISVHIGIYELKLVGSSY